MLSGQYFVLIGHQWTDPLDLSHPTWPNAWMGRHTTPQSAMHQARHLAASFQTVRVWDAQEQESVAEYFQHVSLDRDELDPGHVEFYKTTLERPEGKVQTIGKKVIYAFNRHDRNADYEARRKKGEYKYNRGDEGEQKNSEDVRSAKLGESD